MTAASFNMIPPLSPGSIQCIFDKSNNHYSWKKVTTTVHNIIVGKLWIDQVNLKPNTTTYYLGIYSPVSYQGRQILPFWPLPLCGGSHTTVTQEAGVPCMTKCHRSFSKCNQVMFLPILNQMLPTLS